MNIGTQLKMVALICLMILSPVFGFPGKYPNSVLDTWQGYEQWDKINPLDVEVVKEWDQDNGHFQLVLYSLGKLIGEKKVGRTIAYTTQTTDVIEVARAPKIVKPRIAAYYGYPKGNDKVPAIVHLHGGGQLAGKEYVKYWVGLGYAVISINWGGKILEDETTPNTDWDGLAAGFIGEEDQKHHNDQTPGPNTLFQEPHPFNSSWMLIALAARRALTFLQAQPQVDPDRLGLTGHSMGGRAVVFTAIDPRIKAATPSVGGSGFLYDDLWGLPGSARHMNPEVLPMYRRFIDCASYWPLIKCPILFLGATNDFNSPTDWVLKGMGLLPETTDFRWALAPHLNHRFTSDTFSACVLWFEAHLKNTFALPAAPKAELILKQPDGIPVFRVYPDPDVKLPLKKVDIYYSYGRDPRIRFWRDGLAEKHGDCWEARCPVFYTDEPLFAFANVTYGLDRDIPLPAGYSRTIREVTISSPYVSAYPDQLQAAGVRATETPHRLIDDFSRGFHDWYTLSEGNTHHWLFATRKIVDPSWAGPTNGIMSFEIDNPEPGNTLAVVAVTNEWIGYTGRKKDIYTAIVNLEKAGIVSISLNASDFKNAGGEAMSDWDQITELNFRAADKALPDDPSLTPWKGKVPTLHNLRWEGGIYTKRPKIHETQQTFDALHQSQKFNREFQKAIEDSVAVEQRDADIK